MFKLRLKCVQVLWSKRNNIKLKNKINHNTKGVIFLLEQNIYWEIHVAAHWGTLRPQLLYFR